MDHRREYLKSQHRCVQCGTKDAYTESGRSYCAVCTEKNNAYRRAHYAERRDKKQARAKELRAERKAAGLCTICGIRKPQEDHVQCEICTAKNRRRQEKYRREQGIVPRQMFHSLGLCKCCGKPLDDPEKVQCKKCAEHWESVRYKGKADNEFTRGNEKYWEGRCNEGK